MNPAPLQVDGRFFSYRGERLVLRGVTLGPFPEDVSLAAELPEIAALGANMVRVYDPPNKYFLDQAADLDLIVCASVPWAWGTDFLGQRAAFEAGYLQMRDFLLEYGEHPALGVLYIANEIPQELVRWMGAEQVKHALEELIERLKSEFPHLLYAYANFPTTEFLELENADFCAFNLYLEQEQDLRDYLQHLHIVAGDRPLVISEFGADAGSHGVEGQSDLIQMVMHVVREQGVQGITIFAWSDLWWNRGQLVEGWQFGLKTIENTLRPASRHLRETAPTLPAPAMISVIVCCYNGASRISGCLSALLELNDPRYEVIVINDGSRDGTEVTCATYQSRFQQKGLDYTVYTQSNKGLSNARNRGACIARGEIIAYTDDDARPDRDWLYWLRRGFSENEQIGMCGGYGLQPIRDSPEAQAVAKLPGHASPVLVDNRNAEHLPGCNMAVRKSVWEQIGGFDEHYRVAGDDVDFCWRVLSAGYEIKFHPNAVVWHESRATYPAYLKQQWGYGKAEALLYQDHAERFNSSGIQWSGGVYQGEPRLLTAGAVVYSGWAGSALFQPIIYGSHTRQATTLASRILSTTYLHVRALARWRHGFPVHWRGLLTRSRRSPQSIQPTGITRRYWTTQFTHRASLIAQLQGAGWELLENDYWDMQKGDRYLRLALEQPAEDGQMLLLKSSHPLEIESIFPQTTLASVI